MTAPRRPFADRLLAAAPPSADGRGRYEKEVRAMLDQTLSPRQRGGYLLGAVFLLALGGFFAAVLVAARGDRNEVIPYVVAYGGLTAAACLLAAAPMLRGFWSDTARRAQGWAAGVGVAYVGLVGWGLMAMARVVPEPLRDDTRVFGMVLVVYAAVAWVRHRVARAELNTSVKLLEIELRLAELAEARPAAGERPA